MLSGLCTCCVWLAWCKDHPYLALGLHWTVPTQMPCHTLHPDIQPSFDLPSSFPASFNPLLLPVFCCIFSFSLQCSDSHIPWSLWQPCLNPWPHLNCLVAHPHKSCINHGLATCPIYIAAPSQMGPPFIPSFLSSPHLPCVALKHHPTAIPCVAGITPATFDATWPLFKWIHTDLITCPHWPCTIAPCLEWVDSGYCWTSLLYHLCAHCHFFSFITFPLSSSTASLFVFASHLSCLPFMPLTPQYILCYELHWPHTIHFGWPL